MMLEPQKATKGILRDSLFVAFLSFIWGWSFLAAKIALVDFSPLSVSAGRISIGAFALVCVALYMRVPLLPEKGTWRFFFAMGLLSNALPFTLLNWGQMGVDSIFAGVSMATIPFMVLILSVVILRFSITLWQVLGLAIGFIGVILLIDFANTMTTATSGSLLQKGACIAAAFCYASGSIIIRIGRTINPIQLSATGLSIGAIFMFALVLAIEGLPPASAYKGTSFLALLYLGLGPTALATILLVSVINSSGPTFLSLTNYQVPIWSVILGVIVLKEHLPENFLLATALILSGLFISEFFAQRKTPSKSE